MDITLPATNRPAPEFGVSPPRNPLRRPALLGSLLVHAVVLVLLLHGIRPDDNRVQFVPVELVQLVEKTTTPVPAKPDRPLPLQQNASLRPQTRKAPLPSIPLTPPQTLPSAPEQGTEPVPQPPKDELQSRLEAFAKLNLPGTGVFSSSGTGSGSGAAGYDVKDFVRAQVERHWNVDLDALEDRKIRVAIHVVLAPDGAIRTAEIVNDRREDAERHSLAISARNAVILSSPIALPVGTPPSALDMVLTLSPADTIR
jgi:hypothetical protein